VRRLLLFAAAVLLIACNGAADFGGPCGGGQYADARALLPDSGINAGDTLLVVFTQHDTQELAELVIWHLWPFASGVIDTAPDPRVRVVADDGRVLLDSTGSRYDQPENRFDRPTWYVFTWIRDANLRNGLYEGFVNQTLWIELWRVGAPAPGTRVRLRTDHAGVSPMATCL
jgi:hypothetical protein